MTSGLIPDDNTLTGLEYTTCVLSFRESDNDAATIFSRAAIAQAIHDASERQMNLYGAAGWTLAHIAPISFRRRIGMGKYRAIWLRDHRVSSPGS